MLVADHTALKSVGQLCGPEFVDLSCKGSICMCGEDDSVPTGVHGYDVNGNPIGLQKYSTGYLAGPAGHLQLAAATSLDDMRFVGGKSEDERRAPPPPAQQPATVVFMQMDPRAAQTSKLATATSSVAPRPRGSRRWLGCA